jgi:hypothetical protein
VPDGLRAAAPVAGCAWGPHGAGVRVLHPNRCVALAASPLLRRCLRGGAHNRSGAPCAILYPQLNASVQCTCGHWNGPSPSPLTTLNVLWVVH